MTETAAGSLSIRQRVAPGSLIFVERSVVHRFFDITEDLTVLVFFAPPKGSRKNGTPE
jgi:hypothetical protein